MENIKNFKELQKSFENILNENYNDEDILNEDVKTAIFSLKNDMDNNSKNIQELKVQMNILIKSVNEMKNNFSEIFKNHENRLKNIEK